MSVFRYSVCLFALALLSGVGCSAAPNVVIHAKYAELRPQSIHVLPVRNATFRQDLGKYRLDSRLQGAITGGSEVDVLALFRDEAEEGVLERGFELGADRGGDGVGTMEVVLESWQDGFGYGASDVVVRYSLKLVLPESGELLYSTTVSYRMQSRGSSLRKLTPVELKREIGKTVGAALDRLPPPE